MSTFQTRLDAIRDRVAAAAARAGRKPADVEIMAVSKTLSRGRVEEAFNAGVRLFGENRVAEAVEKFEPRFPDQRLHLVGHLQRNKARAAARCFDQIESIDKSETAASISRAVADWSVSEPKRAIEVLIEVNTSGESTKFGVENDDETRRLAESIVSDERLRLRGLMTIGPFTKDELQIHRAFARLRSSLRILNDELGIEGARTLSMGMSSDFEIAVEEGSTRIRVGTALFGPREQIFRENHTR